MHVRGNKCLKSSARVNVCIISVKVDTNMSYIALYTKGCLCGMQTVVAMADTRRWTLPYLIDTWMDSNWSSTASLEYVGLKQWWSTLLHCELTGSCSEVICKREQSSWLYLAYSLVHCIAAGTIARSSWRIPNRSCMLYMYMRMYVQYMYVHVP